MADTNPEAAEVRVIKEELLLAVKGQVAAEAVRAIDADPPAEVAEAELALKE